MAREPETLMDRVLVSLYHDGPGTPEQIGHRLHVPAEDVKTALDAAAMLGLIEKTDESTEG